MTLDRSITEILSASLAPVTLITGVAFLTSIMAPRFGRCIDRIRVLLKQIEEGAPGAPSVVNARKQLQILEVRTRMLRNTMAAAGVCVLLVIVTIGLTFSNLILGRPGTTTIVITFLSAFVALIALSLGFIYDFLKSLEAVRLEIEWVVPPDSSGEAKSTRSLT